MKGIMILANKGSGPYIDIQHPINLSEELQLKTSVLMSLFEQHRINKREPNYMEMKIKKKVSVAIFYTGYSYERFVGRQNHEIIIFLSENDVLSKDFEGRIRRIAFELLPQRDSPIFNDLFKDYYELLEKQELGPYWEESSGAPIGGQEVESKKEEKVENLLNNIKPITASEQEGQGNKSDFEEQFENFEKPQKIKIVDQLQELAKKESNNIEIRAQKSNEQKSVQLLPSQDIEILEKQLDEQNVLLDEWRKKVEDFSEKNKNLNDSVMKLTGKTSYQAKELESKSLEIEQLKTQLNEKEKFNSNNKNFDTIKNENDELNRRIEELTNQLKEKEKIVDEFKDFDNIKNENEAMKQKFENLNKIIGELKEFNEKVKQENNFHLDAIESLKLEIKGLKEKFSSKTEFEEKTSEQIIELKKELKVLRRERDTYLKKIKEKNLL